MTNYEKETIINFNEAETVASVYTYNAAMKRKLATFSAAYPELCKLTRQDKTGAVTYEVDKKYLVVRFMRPMSAEKLAQARERGKANAATLTKARKTRFDT